MKYKKNRHTNFLVKEIIPVEFCGKNIGYQVTGSSFQLPFKTTPTSGKHKYNKCNSCLGVHSELLDWFTNRYEGNFANKLPFPFCCTYHANLVNNPYFNKKKFDVLNIPVLVANKVLFTQQHIINRINNDDWLEDISEYISYTVSSFGQMPEGCGEPLFLNDYLNYVTQLIKENRNLPEQKRDKIIDFINISTEPSQENNTDLNSLVKIYESWYNIFPFDLTFFSHLRQPFQKQIPILAGNPITNRYSGASYIKFHSKISLIDSLITLTNKIITELNSAILYEKGRINDTAKVQLELILNKRKLKLKQGYSNIGQNEEQRFVEILENWFQDEIDFIKDITPFVEAFSPPSTEAQRPETEKTNTFNRMPLDQVKVFFSPITTEKSKFGQPYLTPEQLENFINRGFCGDLTIPKLTIKSVKREKLFIVKLFYAYYIECTTTWIEPSQQCRDKYIKLLTDNFTNWTFEDIKGNFGNKHKREWPKLLN